MIYIFKSWIQSILCIGILFTIIRIILPNTSLKKYTYSLIGIVTIIAIFNPVINFARNNNITELRNLFLNSAELANRNINYTNISNYEDVNKNNVKENFKHTVEENIKQKIKENINSSVDVNIEITDTYNIKKINITVYEDTPFDISTYISNEYDLDKKIIEVKKEV